MVAHTKKENFLQFESMAQDVYKKLAKLHRTGWVVRGVESPESVKEHTISLLTLAHEMWDELSEDEQDGLLEMLEIHDWPEVITGDEVILELDERKRKILKDTKFESERNAMQQICSELPNGEALFQLWLRYETSDNPAILFARQLDKYQAVKKALEYEETQGIPLFREFVTYSSNFISHPILLKRLEELEKRWNE